MKLQPRERNEAMRAALHGGGIKGKGIVFAALGSGANEREWLKGRIIRVPPWDAGDSSGHETFVCGQLIEWCPEAYVIPYNCTGAVSGVCDTQSMTAALKDVLARAKGDKAHQYIVNMSVSGPGAAMQIAKDMEAVIDELVAADVPVFAAAGNDGVEGSSMYPGCFESPICIAALDCYGNRSHFSTWHGEMDFSDAGEAISGIDVNGGLTLNNGTSMATPNAAGKAGLLMCLYKEKRGAWPTEGELYELMKAAAIDRGSQGLDPYTGWGFVEIGPDMLGEGDQGTSPEPDGPQAKPEAGDKPVLRKGSEGEWTAIAQRLLLSHGYDLGKWGADGKFGEATERATKAFQRAHGLTADGIIGAKTWAALEDEPGEITPEKGESTMKHIQEFLRWAISHASPGRIPVGSSLCVPLEQVGSAGIWQYLYGTTGRKCTQSLLDSKYSQYYKGWGWSRAQYAAATAGWAEQGVTVCDCQGLEDCFSGADANAKGNYANYCENKGRIEEISRDYALGEAVFVGSKPSAINHVGWVAGFAPDGEPLILHERGLKHGCVVERMSQAGKSWSYRGLMSRRYDYGAAVPDAGQEAKPEPAPGGTVLRLAAPLMRGEAIGHLQKGLNDLGYPCGAADGICGEKTLAGIRGFVEAHKGV